MDDNVTAGLVVICVFGLPIAGWILVRIMQHSERMEMIKRGIVPPGASRERWTPPPEQWQSAASPQAASYEAQFQLRKGITTTLVGLALLIGLSFIGYHGNGEWQPGPWLLGGLIPMFVGVARIITAVLWGAQFPRSRSFDLPGGPYAYRPPGTQEELPRTKPPQQPGK